MGCTTEPEFRSSKPRSCNRCCHPSPPEPGAWGMAMATRSLTFPPGGDGMGGEGRRVVRDADADSAAVIRRIVNAVGDAHAAGVGEEVMIVHWNRRAIPFGAGVLEVADQFAFLTVDAEDGKALPLERDRSEEIFWNC